MTSLVHVTPSDPGAVLQIIVIAGLMGLTGQMIRAVVGLKKASEINENRAADFSSPRLFLSLAIGFAAGILAALAMEGGKLTGLAVGETKVLLALMAAGYAGTDFIEGIMPKLLPKVPAQERKAMAATAEMAARETVARTKALNELEYEQTSAIYEKKLAQQRAEAQSVNSAETSSAAAANEPKTDITAKITPDMVKSVFAAATPLSNITKHLPFVISALSASHLGDKAMVQMALATIRAETEGFLPISELKSKSNTDKKPFDRYEPGTSAGKRLGNTTVGDGAKFKGRGFIQLTGRDNYTRIGADLGLDLVTNPELANDSANAGLILSRFLKNQENEIRAALSVSDLKKARRLVNGGQHGFDRFEDTFIKSGSVFPKA